MNRTAKYLEASHSTAALDIPMLVHCLLEDAVNSGASDIHIEPWESSIVVRVRLLGVLNELAHLPLDVMEKLSGRLKILANLVSYQSDLPQEGHVPGDETLGGVEMRVSVFPTVRGEKIVIRLFDPRNRSFDLDELGFDPESLSKLKHFLTRPNGLVLFTGPTGSGKTTAIYGSLAHIVHRSGPTMSISTVEDPVEFHLPMVSQAQVNHAKEFTYPVALRSLMRQDPQVIMVGEIRDADTASIAVQAGLTGHLIISTIHSGSTAGVFARLINMDIEPFLLASSILGVVGLRLIRQNCGYCAAPYEPEALYLRFVPPELVETAVFRKGQGCSHCNQTGFSGRTALPEILEVTEPLRDAILQKLPTRTLQQVAVQHGTQTFWNNGLRRVITGQTPLEEIFRAIAIDQL